MGCSYPGLSMDDLIKLIQNFIDMLILASGYQSTGRLAHWGFDNIKRSFQWALFLENVSKGLRSSTAYEDSVKQLDAALYQLTLSPNFPQGLAHLSCTSLGRARDLVLERLVHSLPMRESHLNAIILACVEMDFSKLERIDNDVLDVYLGKLMSIPSKGLNLGESRNSMEDFNISTSDVVSSGKPDRWTEGDFSVLAVQHLEKRQLSVSHSSAVEAVLENLWQAVGQSMHDEPGNTSNSEPDKAEELPLDSIVWNRWKSRSLSYMLDKRTIRLVAGASLISSAPERRWVQMFERLDISAESDDFCETIELLLLGCTADRWSALIEHLMLVSSESPTMTRLYQEVFNLPTCNSLNPLAKEVLVNPKETSVVNYLEVLLSGKISQLWKLSPVLAAVAIPAWSKLFGSYLHELECQFRGNSLATRRCSCVADAVEHRECEVAERIWCLYIFHICRSHAAS